MRTKHLLMFFAAAIAGGITLNYTNTATHERTYVPQNAVTDMYTADQFQEWLYQVKANQDTRNVTPEMIAKVNEEMMQFMAKSGNHEAFNWKEEGPNNIGGRTRALLIDKNNQNNIWAGAVSGGIWKSTTAGQYWERVDYTVTDGYTPTSVSAIAQAADGKIYFGTGEPFNNNFDVSGTDNQLFTGNSHIMPFIKGGGIFKQEDETFVRLSATSPTNSSDFYGVRRLVAHPTNADVLLAATTTGVWETTDGGISWIKAIDAPGQSWDVAIGTDGTVIANVHDKTYRRLANETSFTVISGLIENNKITEIKGRYVYDFLYSDPNCVFASISDTTGELEGVFRSLNKGTTWSQVGFGHSSQFVPFGSNKQGTFAHSLKALSPINILIAGVDVWMGSGMEGQNVFEWSKMLYSSADEESPIYIHSGIHTFTLKDDSYLFVGTDGGIYKLGDNGLKTMNTYYNSTMCYRADINNKGQMIVGTQDNGMVLLKHDLPGSQQQFGRKVMQGNGTECLFSRLSDDVIIAETQHGNMQRSNNLTTDFYYFWSSKMTSDNGWNSDNFTWPAKNAAWIAPMSLWECDDFSYIRVDTSKVMSLRPYEAGVTYHIQSANVAGQKLWWHADKNYAVGDTITFPDPYQAVFLFGMGNKLWYTKKALNFSPIARFDWWDIYDRANIDNIVTSKPATRFVAVALSPDGDIAYGAVEPNISTDTSATIYRISNLHACVRPRNAALTAFNAVQDPDSVPRLTQIQRIGTIKGRYITSLEVDPRNPEALIVTMGQYGNDVNIYVAKHAATTNSVVWDENFVSIQGNLPKMPVYTACVNKNPNVEKQLVIGTEYGVFVTDNYLSSEVSWQEGNNGLGHYPVFDIKQSYNQRRTTGTYTYGTFVIATYGRGVFIDREHEFTFTNIEEPIIGDNLTSDNTTLNIKLYPNPATDNANINISVNKRAVVEVLVYDLTGKLVYNNKTSKLEAGTHTLTIPVSELTQGTYLVQCISGNTRKTEKLLVK